MVDFPELLGCLEKLVRVANDAGGILQDPYGGLDDMKGDPDGMALAAVVVEAKKLLEAAGRPVGLTVMRGYRRDGRIHTE